MRRNTSVDEDGIRLVQHLMRAGGLSSRQAKRLLDMKNVWVNDRPVWMAKHNLRRGDKVVFLDDALEAGRRDQSVEFLFQDEALLVVSKPPFLNSVGEKSIEKVLAGTPHKLAIKPVHRLDRDTSGCLIFALLPAAHTALLKMFANREIEKYYEAIVRGAVPWKTRSFDQAIEGKRALSHATRLKSAKGASHLGVFIETGRKHQIRRHLAGDGHSVVGEKIYADAINDAARQLLHARRLRFNHPISGARLEIEAPYPDDFSKALTAFGLGSRR